MSDYINKFIDFFTKPTLTDEYIIEKWKKENKGKLQGFATDKEAGFIDTKRVTGNKGLTKIKQNAN